MLVTLLLLLRPPPAPGLSRLETSGTGDGQGDKIDRIHDWIPLLSAESARLRIAGGI
jgi:hypothetical protein